MNTVKEESLREAACIGDLEMVQNLVRQNININCKHNINGWTPLHWACKRGHEQIVKYLLANGADISITNLKGESPVTVCSNQTILSMLGCGEIPRSNTTNNDNSFVPNYIKNAPLNGYVDTDIKHKSRSEISSKKANHAVSSSNDYLVFRIRISGSDDPDFIEIEIPVYNLSYSTLLEICCKELCIKESQVERIRKLPNIRLRNDNDVKRLRDFQYLEVVLRNNIKSEQKQHYPYPVISSCKNETILY